MCDQGTCCCRDVTSERKPYPSFSPEDFPDVYEASQKALKTASMAVSNSPDSQVVHAALASQGEKIFRL